VKGKTIEHTNQKQELGSQRITTVQGNRKAKGPTQIKAL
jgi:hypothetical protein